MSRPYVKKDDIKKPYIQDLLKVMEKAHQGPANADNETMSHAQPQQQQQQGMPLPDEIKGKWKQHLGSAKIAWGELTEDELLKSEGHVQKLAGLVQERYAITREEAEKQVNDFIDSHEL